MSNISRRDFLKTAGVMTLAVAAAGVLAGCEGNTAKPEVPEITQTSVTVGNYTLSLKDVKQYSVKEFDQNTSGANETNKLENETRYVVALLNLSIIDESKYDATNKDALFAVTPVTNMTTSVTVGDTAGNITVENVRKLFNLDQLDKLEAFDLASGEFEEYDPTGVKKGAGKNYIVAYEVNKTAYADKTIEFKAPTLSFVVDDAEGFVYTKMDATIPAAVTVKKEELIKA